MSSAGRHRGGRRPAGPSIAGSPLPIVAGVTVLVVALVILAGVGAGSRGDRTPPAADSSSTAARSSTWPAVDPPSTIAASSSPLAGPVIVKHYEATVFGYASAACVKPTCAATATAGDEIRPGKWSSNGGPACHWSRNAGASWETGGDPRAPITIHLGNGATFATFGCAQWRLYSAD